MRARTRKFFRAGAFAVASRQPFPAFQAGSVAKHDRADFAQEFLRRNSAYRTLWTAASATDDVQPEAVAQPWGLVRLFDPDRPVRASPAIWRIDAASQVVPLHAVSPALPDAAPIPKMTNTVAIMAGGRRHLVIDAGGVRHRLEVLASDETKPLAILMGPLADTWRATACDAARRLFSGLGMRETAAALRPSGLQRQRLALLLRVLDASLAGANLREIGTEIVYPWMHGTSAHAWKASSERRRVQRLVAEAHRLAAGSYRALLRP